MRRQPTKKGLSKPTTRGPKRGTGRETAYQTLRSNILDLTLEPGAALDEAALVKQLQLSRTPLREALVRLASENLVEMLPNRGARVAEISVAKLAEYFEALGLVQRATHRWAAIRHTNAQLLEMKRHMDAYVHAVRRDPLNNPVFNRAFHSAIAASCENAHFIRLYEELLDQGMRLSRLTVVNETVAGVTAQMHAETLIQEHAAILAAIEARDPVETDKLAGIHNDLFRRKVFNYFILRHNGEQDLVPLYEKTGQLAF